MSINIVRSLACLCLCWNAALTTTDFRNLRLNALPTDKDLLGYYAKGEKTLCKCTYCNDFQILTTELGHVWFILKRQVATRLDWGFRI